MENINSPMEQTFPVQAILNQIKKDHSRLWVDLVRQADLYNEPAGPSEEPQGYAAFFDWWK